MASRLVRMPVFPSVTSSCALNLRVGVSKARTEAREVVEDSHAAPIPVAVLRRKSLLSMAHLLPKRILRFRAANQASRNRLTAQEQCVGQEGAPCLEGARISPFIERRVTVLQSSSMPECILDGPIPLR